MRDNATSSEKEKLLVELVLYVAQKSEDDPQFGATKLNKILFYSDFGAWFKLGTSITGEEYVRREYGPTPRTVLAAISTLEASGRAVQREMTFGAYRQRRLVPLHDADLSIFTATEIAYVDGVIDWLRRLSATEVSNLSHSFPGWCLATDGETIPYFTALLASEPLALTDAEKAWAAGAIARLDAA